MVVQALFLTIFLSFCFVDANNCSLIAKTGSKLIDKKNKFKLWPGLMSKYDIENGETLIGLEEALDIIWKNQNPPDCSKAKYLIAEPFLQGVGSEMHVYGVGLGMAIETGRVYLQQGGWSWRFKNYHCASQNKQSMECYYQSWSKCTLQDAAATMRTTNPLFPQPDTAKQFNMATSPILNSLKNMKVASISPTTTRYHPNNFDADLSESIKKFGVQAQWQNITAEMNKKSYNKSDADCLFRFRSVLRKQLNSALIKTGPLGKANFNDDDSIVDVSIPGYGVVAMNRIIAADYNKPNNTITMYPRHLDKFSDNVMMLSFRVMVAIPHYIPNSMQFILPCLQAAHPDYHQQHQQQQEQLQQQQQEQLQHQQQPEQLQQQRFEIARQWWRAVTVAYFMRPNDATLTLLQQHADPLIQQADGKCVSAYVRHGDKGVEMSLVPFQQYADSAMCLWKVTTTSSSSNNYNNNESNGAVSRVLSKVKIVKKNNNNNNIVGSSSKSVKRIVDSGAIYPACNAFYGRNETINKQQSSSNSKVNSNLDNKAVKLLHDWDSSKDVKLFYIGSEDPVVFDQAKIWGKKHNITVRYSKISQILLSDHKSIMTHKSMETAIPTNRQLEYFSYLLHLHDLVKCRAILCTLASNYCRLVDELRATVGGKSNSAYMVDLSRESCLQPPCVRRESAAVYRSVFAHDPMNHLW